MAVSTYIQVKNGVSVPFVENNITLEQWQLNKIVRQARNRTLQSWLDSGGIKIPLTYQQCKDLLHVKNMVFAYLSSHGNAQQILRSNRFGFESHAYERIVERLEPITEQQKNFLLSNKDKRPLRYVIHPHTLEKTVKVLMFSNKVKAEARWKGYRTLSYTFQAQYDQKELDIVVRFDRGLVVVTIINVIDHGFYIGETEEGQKLREEQS